MASNGRIVARRPIGEAQKNGWLPAREQNRLDNRIKQRAVVGWDMTGSTFYRDRRLPGHVRLHLEGGGWLWFPENTKLDDAIAQAEDHGFEVTKVRADLDEWVRTGKGVSFRLVQP